MHRFSFLLFSFLSFSFSSWPIEVISAAERETEEQKFSQSPHFLCLLCLEIGDLCDFLCDQKLVSSVAMYSQQHGHRMINRSNIVDDRFTQQQLQAGGVPLHGASVQPPSATQRAPGGLTHGSLSSPRASGISTRTLPSQSASARP